MLPQLTELQVRNLALIEHATVRLDSGLNVITGETGAGKTMLAKALDLLLGAKTPRNVVRPGAEAAYIEAIVEVPEGWNPDPEDDQLTELIAEADGELVIARRISASGRSRCLIGGRTVALETLRTVAGAVITFYGQHEQRRLMLDRTQAHLLDSSGDGSGVVLHAAYLAARADAVAAARHLDELRRQANDDQRALDLARFELEELQQLNPQPGEEPALISELAALEAAQDGQAGCATAVACLSGDGDGSSAVDLVRRAAAELSGLPSDVVGDLRDRLESAMIELDDIADETRRLAETWTADPHRQAEVQSRLEAIHRLQRKHRTADADDLIAVMQRLENQVRAADDLPARIVDAQRDAQRKLEDAEQAAGKLSVWRAKRAKQLVKAVSASLADLAMAEAKFSVRLDPVEGEGLDALAERGAERPVFALQANPGLPEEDLSRVASGGEASRLMLALISETVNGDGGLLVLDEPDAGLGGHTAHGVASRLKAISASRQVLVISHLPQIAARADRHLRLQKITRDGSTSTTIDSLDTEQARVDELCRLAGHDPADEAARQAMSALRSAT